MGICAASEAEKDKGVEMGPTNKNHTDAADTNTNQNPNPEPVDEGEGKTTSSTEDKQRDRKDKYKTVEAGREEQRKAGVGFFK